MKTIEPIELPSIHEEIQHRLKEYILANNLQAGAPLPSETQLAGQLGVSRAVVREALRSLESLGVIHSRRGAGRYVSQFNLDPVLQNLSYGMLFDVEDLQEIIDVRERLEASFLADAIEATLAPRGVLVVIEAEHLCMSMRGVRKPGSSTVTSSVHGIFRENHATRAEAMRFLQGGD